MTEARSAISGAAPADFDPVIKLLSDGCFHSGEELGRLLGVSRTIVWRRLQNLQRLLGIKFEAVPGRGYRLAGGLELLDAERVRPLLSPAATDWLQDIEVHRQINSTNYRARRLVESGARSGIVVTAECQTAGSGRRGRKWISPFGRNIYYSSLWTFNDGVGALEGLSLVIGIVVARVIAPLTDRKVQLKWPNDVLVDDRKIAGILLEVVGDLDGECTVVIGIGINVHMVGAGEAEAIDQAWTDLSSIGCLNVSRNEVLSSLIVEMVRALSLFEEKGFEAFRCEWDRFDYLRGKAVTMEVGEETRTGFVLGLDESGALLVNIDGEIQVMHGGEVSVRSRC